MKQIEHNPVPIGDADPHNTTTAVPLSVSSAHPFLYSPRAFAHTVYPMSGIYAVFREGQDHERLLCDGRNADILLLHLHNASKDETNRVCESY